MSLKKKTLILGGGISGMCLAIEMRKDGHPVDLVDTDPAWGDPGGGAGITLSGATLRALKEIGVIGQVMAQGCCVDGFSVGLANGEIVNRLPTPRLAGPDIPGGGAIMQPVLAAILAAATRASGAALRLGVSPTSLEQDGTGVRAVFSDGRSDSYDAVVGADGLWSTTRAAILPGAPAPVFTGYGSWRAVVPRLPQIEHATVFLGKVKASLHPVSKDEMYLAVLEPLETDAALPPQTWPEVLAGLLGGFSGTVGEIRDGLDPQSRIVYRPLETLLVPRPWHRGSIGLIGDALHATTPHLASSAGIGIEDAIVLAQELGRHARADDAFAAFTARRFERCALVVQASAQLGAFERTGTLDAKEAHGKLMRSTMQALALPI